MAVAQRYAVAETMGRGGPSGLADVLEVLLDKGLVVDAFVRVSLVGIELLTIDARVVVASVDTYLRFAEAANRLDLQQATNAQTLGDLLGGRDGAGGRGGAGNGSGRRSDEDGGRKDRELGRGGDRHEAERGEGGGDRERQPVRSRMERDDSEDDDSRDEGRGRGRSGRSEARNENDDDGPGDGGDRQAGAEGDGDADKGLISRIRGRGQAF